MKVLVVDDEELARDRLIAQLSDLPEHEVVGTAADGIGALAVQDSVRADVILLDVRMPGMDGLETARHLQRLAEPPVVIFITAYDEHALAAFESHALDYLLKPVRTERLRAALARAATWQAGRASRPALPACGPRSHVSAIAGDKLRLLAVADIVFFQAVQGYVVAAIGTELIVVEESLRTLEEEFGERFVRIHRNALVAPARVRALERDLDGNLAVVFHGRGERLPVSRRLFSQVRKRLRGR